MSEHRCRFIAFFCNGCESEPCNCAEHGESIDVCLALNPDYPDESKKRESLSFDWSLEFCTEGGFETCPDYQRARADAASSLLRECGKVVRLVAQSPRHTYCQCLVCKVVARVDAWEKGEG